MPRISDFIQFSYRALRDFSLFVRFVIVASSAFFITLLILNILGVIPLSSEELEISTSTDRLSSDIFQLIYLTVLLIPHRWSKTKSYYYLLVLLHFTVMLAFCIRLYFANETDGVISYIYIILSILTINSAILWLNWNTRKLSN
jgi:hypothetical protein